MGIEENRKCIIKKLMKKFKRTHGLAKDCVLVDGNGLIYQMEEETLQYKKELWVARTRIDKTAKLSEFLDMKVIVEHGEATIYVDAKIFSCWGKQAMNSYLNQLTGLKNIDFMMEINGIRWDNGMSIGSLKPKVIRVFPDQQVVIYNVISLVDSDILNVHAVSLKVNGQYLSLTAPKNIPLGQAFAMWCILGVDIPRFSYIQVDGRRLSNFEYNVETLGHWPWNKVFILMNDLKGGINFGERIKQLYNEFLVRNKIIEMDGKYVNLLGISKWLYLIILERIVESYECEKWEIEAWRVEDMFCELWDSCYTMFNIERKILDYENIEKFDPISRSLRKDLKFVVDLLTLNALNEDDRKFIEIMEEGLSYLQFNGRRSFGIGMHDMMTLELMSEPVRKVMYYKCWLTGTGLETDRDKDIAETVIDWQIICYDVIEKFDEEEDLRNWEPKVSRIDKNKLNRRIRKQISGEEFTVKILSKVFIGGMENTILNKSLLIWKKLAQKKKQVKSEVKYLDGGKFGIKIKMGQFGKQ
jgi:hypothetical protein